MPDLSLAGALMMPFMAVIQTIRMFEMLDDLRHMAEVMAAQIRERMS